MYEGHQVSYSRPGTGKVDNPHLQAHASPPVRQAWREARQHEEAGESSKVGSPFTPEIHSKPLPATFRLPALEPY
ncbi:hypothetical protein B296_00017490, partial [Ensete ventricosum]